MTDSTVQFASHFAALSSARQTLLPKRLLEPGPDAVQMQQLLSSAASAPDHGQILPWRIVVVPAAVRGLLAEQFAAALVQRDAAALPHQVEQAREKAFRAPLLMLVVVDGLRGGPNIDLLERTVSAGCAVQNVLLMATAQGFGSALTSGKALKADGFRRLFGLAAHEHAVCFISVGTAHTRKPGRVRPSPHDFVSYLSLDYGLVQGLPPHAEETA